MSLSLSTFFTVTFFSSISIILIWSTLKANWLIKQIGISSLFFCIAIIIVRLLIPLEFSFANNIPINRILPWFTLFFETPIITFRDHTICFRHILYLLWIIGALFCLGKSIYTYTCFKRLMDTFSSITNPKIQSILHNIISKYKKPINFEIIQAELVSTPMIFGIRKPKIFIPQIDLSEDEWYHIMNHEVAHYYHGDLLIKLITELISIVYWWNPIVYLLKKQISKLLEIHIDITITKSMSEIERIDYLECLLKISKMRLNKKTNRLVLTFSSNSSSPLFQRFDIILKGYNQKKKVNLKSMFFTVIPTIFMIVLSLLFVFEPYSISAEDAAHTIELTSKTAYLIPNQDNGYDLYYNDNFFGVVTKIRDSYSDLPIYNNIKEVPLK
ncbi:M56 family metallopeptidase [Clostridium sp. Marseille-P2415]|uniref:M56 family metallopeptidase n=1 Tax=Clostridium sp. Marseille-P2415 TaxID=1805471 RepID=UPI000988876A|nr:M56 family metallopeptidase [Clostridium sp. Marseille-P2415]